MTSIRAGIAYFAAVFAMGFLLGVLRVFYVLPWIGETRAVMLELPVMLTGAWFVCRLLIARLKVPPLLRDRLSMGMLAFALILIAEVGVSMSLGGSTFAEHLASYRQLPAQLGAVAQLLTALYPAIQNKTAQPA
jgi:hypothetical protein